MVYDDDIMRRALRRLFEVDPETIEDLVDLGPLEEPLCGVCSSLVPIVNEQLPGWRAALDVLMYHDEPTYIGEAPGMRDYEADVPWSIGLTQVVTYIRCLRVYEEARALLS